MNSRALSLSFCFTPLEPTSWLLRQRANTTSAVSQTCCMHGTAYARAHASTSCCKTQAPRAAQHAPVPDLYKTCATARVLTTPPAFSTRWKKRTLRSTTSLIVRQWYIVPLLKTRCQRLARQAFAGSILTIGAPSVYGKRPASHFVSRRPVAIGESSLRPTTGKPLCSRRPVAIGEPSTLWSHSIRQRLGPNRGRKTPTTAHLRIAHS